MEDKELIAAAKKYRENAYAPYSKFKVGAAVLTKKGNVYGGCNIENSSFPVTNCAERTAIFKAVSEGEQEFAAIALIADTPGPCSPCGACRQVMVEFKIPRIIMANMQGEVKVVTLEEIMPYAFTEF
ncbi:MAG: cytidine deaminase [Selenomonas ruminantium]|uniref:Cytidine deaminase n=1 Tax=Selenomonas ruminantium TaxID=971 RepID=A0A927WP69_SELRU|nr:cytidine deaminase [Selenomonas ruminantium]MBE6086328.1 cytidine deaminase [Selenomonas ruminantium]